MKQVGKVKKYNGRYGIIETSKGDVDFSKNDISFSKDIKEGNEVLFRVEEKSKSLKLARNITIKKD